MKRLLASIGIGLFCLSGIFVQGTSARSSNRHRETRRQLRASLQQRQTVPHRLPSRSQPSSPSSPPRPFQPNQLFIPGTPLPDLSAVSHFLVLGNKGPPIATIKVTPQDEPVLVRTVQVRLSAEISSIASLDIFDEFGFRLGVATLDLAASSSHTVFTLHLSTEQAYFIEKRETAIFVVRPLMKGEQAGGVSGQNVQVSSITPTAVGSWTSQENIVSTSGTDFQQHQTTNAVLTVIKRSGKEQGTFTTGTQKAIGAFTFEARKTIDGDPALQTLLFSVSARTEVTLSNVFIRGNDGDSSHPCSVAAGTITCSSIPASIGSLSSPRTITVYADVSLNSAHPNPFLQIELNQAGRPGSSGDITWTDGDTSFSWVPFNSPVAQGTVWK